MITKSTVGTGGHFSISYKVTNEKGEEAFLKALDFSGALKSSDRLKALEEMLAAYNFERDLLEKCKTNKIDRVITPIDHGAVEVAGFGEYSSVHYLIFDLAEGDLRNYTSNLISFDLSWCLRSLHHIAIGLKQLHWNGIAHQDLKPSNVLIMNQADTKISDLGRASDKNKRADHDSFTFAGDRSYAPHDIYYPDSGVFDFERKFLTDIYLFGSLLFFYFSNVNATQAIITKLAMGQRDFGKAPFKEVLPYLQEAFRSALEDLRKDIALVTPELADELVLLAKQLCEPDPSLRGDPSWHKSTVPNYDLQRIISKLDILCKSVRK